MSAIADDLHDQIVNLLNEMEPDALRTMLYLAERLMLGQRSYGRLDLKTDPRNWPEEQRAEIGDLLAYFAFEELKRQLSGEVRGPASPPARASVPPPVLEATADQVSGRRRSSGCQSSGIVNGILIQCQNPTLMHEGPHRSGQWVWPLHE